MERNVDVEHGQPQPDLMSEEHSFAVNTGSHTLAFCSILVLPFEDSHDKIGAKSERKSGDIHRQIDVLVLLKILTHTSTHCQRDMRVGVEDGGVERSR